MGLTGSLAQGHSTAHQSRDPQQPEKSCKQRIIEPSDAFAVAPFTVPAELVASSQPTEHMVRCVAVRGDEMEWFVCFADVRLLFPYKDTKQGRRTLIARLNDGTDAVFKELCPKTHMRPATQVS